MRKGKVYTRRCTLVPRSAHQACIMANYASQLPEAMMKWFITKHDKSMGGEAMHDDLPICGPEGGLWLAVRGRLITLHKVNRLEFDGLAGWGQTHNPGWGLETVHRFRPEGSIWLGSGNGYRWARGGRGASSAPVLEAYTRHEITARDYVVDLKLLVTDSKVDSFGEGVYRFDPVGSSRCEPMPQSKACAYSHLNCSLRTADRPYCQKACMYYQLLVTQHRHPMSYVSYTGAHA